MENQSQKIIALLGPTNTGKTHVAIEKMLEVESAIFGHGSISDVAVIGIPDETWGEAVKAIVVLKDGTTASEEDIIDFTRDRIAGFKSPKSVDFISELPRNPSGKILKKEFSNALDFSNDVIPNFMNKIYKKEE